MSKWVIGKYIRLSQADRNLTRNDKKAEMLDGQIRELEESLHRTETESDDGTKGVMKTMEKYSGATELTQDMVYETAD